MSLRLTIVGKTYTELQSKLLQAAKDIGQTTAVHSNNDVGTTSDSNEVLAQAAKLNASTPYGNIGGKADLSSNSLAERPANSRPFTQTAGKRRGPKSKAEKAAGNSFLGQTHVPLVSTPQQPMPTTQFNAGMPQMGGRADNLKPMEQPATPIVQQFAPPQAAPTPVNGYTFATFKANFIHIINTLANDGRIDDSWIAINKDHFGGAPVHDWIKQEQTLEGLFGAMVEWNLVEKIG